MSGATWTSRELPGDYEALVREHPPLHIATKRAYRAALRLMDRLAAALAFLMAQHEMSAADLARLLGCDASLASRIVRGERNLTLDHIRALSEHFGVRPGDFV